MDAKEIRLYVFFGIGGLLLVDYMTKQAKDIVNIDATRLARETAQSLGQGIGQGTGQGFGKGLASGAIDGLFGLFKSSPETVNTPPYFPAQSVDYTYGMG